MNIRYPIYEGVYRILTFNSPYANQDIHIILNNGSVPLRPAYTGPRDRGSHHLE